MSWSAQVLLKWNPESVSTWKEWDWSAEWPEVKTAWSTMGDWDMSLWVDANTPEELEKFVCEKLRAKNWITDTKSIWWNQVWAKDAA